MTSANNYLLKQHSIYADRVAELTRNVKKLKARLSPVDFSRHPFVKFAWRVRKAERELIPENPDHPDYQLKGNLKRFRRFKKGIKRYRVFFCFSQSPKIILYLYLNNDKTLRKEGDKNDPYLLFKKYVDKGVFSHGPTDKKITMFLTDIL
jgi:toxin YhaV